jgi:hypothetical protein
MGYGLWITVMGQGYGVRLGLGSRVRVRFRAIHPARVGFVRYGLLIRVRFMGYGLGL